MTANDRDRKRKLNDVEQEYPSPKRFKSNENTKVSEPPILSLDSNEQKDGDQFALNPEKIIELQVGERRYTTKIKTLTQMENENYFAKLFSGAFATNTTHNGYYFIDRDGDIFDYILQYLRTNSLVIPNIANKQTLLQKILIEAQYFLITNLIKFIQEQLTKPKHPKILPSEILSDSEQMNMKDFLADLGVDESFYKWKKCRSHRTVICNYDKNIADTETVILIEDSAGNVFGIKTMTGVCSFADLYPEKKGDFMSDRDVNKELRNDQYFNYFNVRDPQQNISPFTVLARGNECMGGFATHKLGGERIDMTLRCSAIDSLYSKSGKIILDIPSSRRFVGLRLVALENVDTYAKSEDDKDKYVLFQIRKIEQFVLEELEESDIE